MKKFSTFNGLFTHCTTNIPKNLGQNLKQEDMGNSNFEEKLEDIKNLNQTDIPKNNTENNEDFLHYPQADNNFQFENVENSNSNAPDNTEKDDNIQKETENSPNYSEYKLSHNAKMILECMRMHDKIINNFDKSAK